MPIQSSTPCSSEPVPQQTRATTHGFCSGCGAAAQPGAKFCSECGLPLTTPVRPLMKAVPAPEQPPDDAVEHGQAVDEPTQVPVPAPAPPVRPAAKVAPSSPAICNCGKTLPPDAIYCPHCGARIGEIPTTYRLVQVTPDGKGPSFDINSDEVTIGKDDACDVSFPHDEFISRRHARVVRTNGMFFIEDLGSSNGTLLKVRREIALDVGDEIVLGTTVLRLEETR